MASYRFAGRPRWVAGHVLVLAAVVTMVLLGRWQLLVSNRKHFDLQNFGYSIQWWAFSAFAVVFWVKILRDQAKVHESVPSQPAEPDVTDDEPVAYRRYVMPTATSAGVGDEPDAEIARYNAYLASLASRSEQDDK